MIFFFFKQKTYYEMRISDWSSDVCSSDLSRPVRRGRTAAGGADRACGRRRRQRMGYVGGGAVPCARGGAALGGLRPRGTRAKQIGRASCRERVCQYV